MLPHFPIFILGRGRGVVVCVRSAHGVCADWWLCEGAAECANVGLARDVASSRKKLQSGLGFPRKMVEIPPARWRFSQKSGTRGDD